MYTHIFQYAKIIHYLTFPSWASVIVILYLVFCFAYKPRAIHVIVIAAANVEND